MSLTMVTGGARSGKSTFAEELVNKLVLRRKGQNSNAQVLYIATAIPFDAEMKIRIQKHREQRSRDWRTIEQSEGLATVFQQAEERIILLDCITVMLGNLLFSSGVDEEMPNLAEVAQVEKKITDQMTEILDVIKRDLTRDVVIVTNELGLGLVPAYPLGRIFRDLAGRINQKIAKASDHVYFVISGIPTLIKGVDL